MIELSCDELAAIETMSSPIGACILHHLNHSPTARDVRDLHAAIRREVPYATTDAVMLTVHRLSEHGLVSLNGGAVDEPTFSINLERVKMLRGRHAKYIMGA